MSNELLDSLAPWKGVETAIEEIRACHGAFDDFFVGVFDELESLVGKVAARQKEFEQTTLATRRQEAERLEEQIAVLVEQQTLFQRQQAVQATELQAARQQATSLAEQLAAQKLQADRWQEIALLPNQLNDMRALLERQVLVQESQVEAMREQAQGLSELKAKATDRQEAAAIQQELVAIQAGLERQQAAQDDRWRGAEEQAAAVVAHLSELAHQVEGRDDAQKLEAPMAELRGLLECQVAAQEAQVEAMREQAQGLAELKARATDRQEAAAIQQELAALQASLDGQQSAQEDRWRPIEEQATAVIAHLSELAHQVEGRDDAKKLDEPMAEMRRLLERQVAAQEAQVEAMREQAQELAALKTKAADRQVQQELAALQASLDGQQSAQEDRWRAIEEQAAAVIAHLSELAHQVEGRGDAKKLDEPMAEMRRLLERQVAAQEAQVEAMREQAQELAALKTKAADRQVQQELAALQASLDGQQSAQEDRWRATEGQVAAVAAQLSELAQQVEGRDDAQKLEAPLAELRGLLERQVAAQEAQLEAMREQVQELAALKAKAADHQEAAAIQQELAALQACLGRQYAAQEDRGRAAEEQVAAVAARLSELTQEVEVRDDARRSQEPLAELRGLLERQVAAQETQLEAMREQIQELAELKAKAADRPEAAPIEQAMAEIVAQELHRGLEEPPPDSNPLVARESSGAPAAGKVEKAQQQARWNELLRARSKAKR